MTCTEAYKEHIHIRVHPKSWKKFKATDMRAAGMKRIMLLIVDNCDRIKLKM